MTISEFPPSDTRVVFQLLHRTQPKPLRHEIARLRVNDNRHSHTLRRCLSLLSILPRFLLHISRVDFHDQDTQRIHVRSRGDESSLAFRTRVVLEKPNLGRFSFCENKERFLLQIVAQREIVGREIYESTKRTATHLQDFASAATVRNRRF